MRITPFYNSRRTVCKLTVEEWLFNLLLGVMLPTFINTMLALFDKSSGKIFFLFLPIVLAADFLIIYVKSREDNYFQVWFANRRIKDKLEGSYENLTPVTTLKDSNEKLLSPKG